MKKIWIGCGQLTWKNVDESQVLAEIAQAGYDGAPAGPRQGETTAATLARFAKAGLRPAPGYLGAEFWRADLEAEILARAEQYANFAQAAGYTELYVAAGGGDYVTARG